MKDINETTKDFLAWLLITAFVTLGIIVTLSVVFMALNYVVDYFAISLAMAMLCIVIMFIVVGFVIAWIMRYG